MSENWTYDPDLVRAYNYAEFVDEKFEQWMQFDQSPPLGQPAPNFEVADLDGQPVHLSDVWRAHAYTIIEFGSLT